MNSEHGCLIWISDRNEGQDRRLHREMAKAGLRVMKTPRGQAGLELAREHRPCFILVSQELADMSVVGFIKQLRARSEVPVYVPARCLTELRRFSGIFPSEGIFMLFERRPGRRA